MSEGANIRDEDLHAFLDGALDGPRSQEIAARIDADPALAARLAGFRADKGYVQDGLWAAGATSRFPNIGWRWPRGAKPAPRLSWRMVGHRGHGFWWRWWRHSAIAPGSRPPAPARSSQAALAARQAGGRRRSIAVSSTGRSGRYDRHREQRGGAARQGAGP